MNWVTISDELSGCGWRLAGAQVLIADEHSVQDCFAQAALSADVVFITADLAAYLPDPVLKRAELAEKPLLVTIARLPRGSEPPDLEQEVKHLLGITL